MNELQKAIEKKRNPEGYVLARLEEMEMEFEAKLSEMEAYKQDTFKKIEDAVALMTEKIDSLNRDEMVEEVASKFTQPENGVTPSDDQIISLFTPFIPHVENGKTPTKKELRALMSPLVTAEIASRFKDFNLSREELLSLITKSAPEDATEFVSETGEALAGKLNATKESLDMSVVKGLKEAFTSLNQNIRTMLKGNKKFAQGGGDSVLAGTGISVTRTLGRKVITNTSAGGFTTLSATETPDGIITVFTFSGASAQPTYIVVDGVWMKATTAKGTVNWTWNAGTKKATLTIPAQDDILGVV